MSSHRHRHQPSSPRKRWIADAIDQHLFEAVWLWQKHINRPDEEHYDDAWDEMVDRLHDQWDIIWNVEAPK